MTKPTNPKDCVAIKKPRFYSGIPANVLREVGVSMLEGAMKYGRHNFRKSGVRASVYVDATMGHILDYWEGEDIDPESNLHHITKAISSLCVLRDAQMLDMCQDDRPPKSNIQKDKEHLQTIVDALFEKYPVPEQSYLNIPKVD